MSDGTNSVQIISQDYKSCFEARDSLGSVKIAITLNGDARSGLVLLHSLG